MHPITRLASFVALLLPLSQLAGQTPCGTPHLVGLTHPATASSTRLFDVFALSTSDVWAVGQRHEDVLGQTHSFSWIVHWDGQRFTEVPSPSPTIPGLRTWCELRAVGGTGPNDMWAAGLYERRFPNNGHVGPQILLLHWDGSSWTQIPEPLPQFTYMASASGTRIDDIEALAPNDVWFHGWWPGDQFTGAGPLTVHWDGSNATVVGIAPLPNSNNMWGWNDVDTVPGGDAWGVASTNGGNYSTYVARRTGGSWTLLTVPKLPLTYYQMFAVGARTNDDVWVGGSEQTLNPSTPIAPYTIHWDGTAWTRHPTAGYVRAFVTFASNDVWAFGTTIEHWNGAAWTLVERFADTLAAGQSHGASATGPCDIWTVGTQWTTANGPPVIALAAHVGPAIAGSATLRLPCSVPPLRQSLLPLSLPVLGQWLRLQVDDPFGTAGVGPFAPNAWLFSFGPGPLAPCGVVLPGIGLGGASIEILLDGSFVIASLGIWSPGAPTEHAFFLPQDPALAGLPLASQGLFLDGNGLLLTSAIDLVLGQ